MAYQKREEPQATPVTVMFTDIETVPQYGLFVNAPEYFRELFVTKFQRDVDEITNRNTITEGGDGEGVITRFDKEQYQIELQEYYQKKASLHAEFGKIVCISFGIIVMDGALMKLKLKSVAGRDEKKLLVEAFPILNKAVFLCAHNGINFDFGFIARRYLIYKMAIPTILNTMGKKPWEVSLIDTMQLWGFMAFNYTSSLNQLAYVFGLPSPKEKVSGKDVYALYYHRNKTDELPWEGEEERLAVIVEYCELDVVTLANVYLCLTQWAIIPAENVIKGDAKTNVQSPS